MTEPHSPPPASTAEDRDANVTRDSDSAPQDAGTLETHEHATAPSSTGLSVGSHFGRYRVVKLLGRGGMGSVYLAEDSRLDRHVALKVPHLGAGQRGTAERFLKEARLTAGLAHPNICTVYDAGEENGQLYITMAYVEGQPLRDRLDDYAGGPPARVIDLILRIANAVGAAHERGVIHRDLKPGNVMLDVRGQPIVMDFGLARHLGAATETRPGTPLGTPAYMPPEQARGDLAAIGPHSDVYSLGVMLYELLTGQLPFQADNVMAILYQVLHEPAPALAKHRASLDPRLDAICQKALAKDPAARFASMAELSAALAAFQSGGAGAGAATSTTDAADGGAERQHFGASMLARLRENGWDRGLQEIRKRWQALHEKPGADDRAQALAWLEGATDFNQIPAPVRQSSLCDALRQWALLGQAIRAMREYRVQPAYDLLDEITATHDAVLAGSVEHLRAALHLRTPGRRDDAVHCLHDALAKYGREHFLVGRVLDTLGMVHAAKDNFYTAREFYRQAKALKERHHDDAGVALTHGQLGRLCLDWGDLDRAEEHFQQNLRLVQRIRDQRAEAQMLNHLGQVALARGDQERAQGRKAAARRENARAADWLDASIRLAQGCKHAVQEAFACKDRAAVHRGEGQLDEAEQLARRAGTLFAGAGFAEGAAFVERELGCIARERGQADAAQELLTRALDCFDRAGERAEGARTQLELARTLQGSQSPRRLVSEAFANALARAEECRRVHLVARIEEELKAEDEEAHWRQVFRRVRGRSAPEDTSALFTGTSEVASILFLNLRGFIPFCQGLDPGEVMTTLNQMLADLAVVLERHHAEVTAYLGGGFMALLRDTGHAHRAVQAGLELLALIDEFNCPRELLGLRRIPAEIGIATGPVCVGNIGTYHKMNFTAVGFAVNLAGRLMRHALKDVAAPCISQQTYELVRDRFLYHADRPRVVDLRDIGPREVWDVVARNADFSSGGSHA